MRKAKFQQISEGAFFLFEPRTFNGTLFTYDPRIANQTILSSWTFPPESESDSYLDDKEERPFDKEEAVA